MISVTDLDERIERCLAILAKNPHSQVFAALAEAYRRRGEFGHAFSVCKSGLKHHPDYAPAYVVLAKLYLHQKMIPEASEALSKAISLEGATRATDLLEAELHLAGGDLATARAMISRLQRAQPNNPAVEDLAHKLLAQEESSPKPDSTPADHAQEIENQPKPEPPDHHPQADRADDWDEWSRQMANIPGVGVAAVYDANGDPLVAHDDVDKAEWNAEPLHTMYREIDSRLKQDEWGALAEIRVETEAQQIWAGRVDGFVLGVIGNRQLAFGGMRRRALETSPQPMTATPDRPEDDPTLCGDAHGTPDTDATLPRVGQGHDHDA